MGQAAADNALIWQLLPRIKQIISEADGTVWSSKYQSAIVNGRGSQTVLSAQIQGTQLWLKCTNSSISHNSWGGKTYSLEIASDSGPTLRVLEQPEDSEVAKLYAQAQTAYELAQRTRDQTLEKSRADARAEILRYLNEELPRIIKEKLADWIAHREGHRTAFGTSFEGIEFVLLQENLVYFSQEFPTLRLIGRKKLGEELVHEQIEGPKVEAILSLLKSTYPKLFIFPVASPSPNKKVPPRGSR